MLITKMPKNTALAKDMYTHNNPEYKQQFLPDEIKDKNIFIKISRVQYVTFCCIIIKHLHGILKIHHSKNHAQQEF